MLYKDERFTNKIINRWHALREDLLSDERLFNYIDDVVEYLGPAVDRNYEVWGYTLDPETIASLPNTQKLRPDEENPTSYEEAIQDFKDFIKERGQFMDENIETLRQFSHESAVKAWNY